MATLIGASTQSIAARLPVADAIIAIDYSDALRAERKFLTGSETIDAFHIFDRSEDNVLACSCCRRELCRRQWDCGQRDFRSTAVRLSG
jgi:hypothetical protein